MQLGPWQIAALETGTFRLDGGAMFGVVPKVLWERTNPADERNRIAMSARSIVVQGKGRVILVDAGIGGRWAQKQRDIYAIDHDDARLDAGLAALGVRREAVTDVVLTHLHFDHVGAATREVNGKVELTFPNARFYIQEQQLAHARNPTEKDRASFRPELWEPLEKEGLLEVLQGPEEIFPGVRAIVTHGHTPGHQALRFEADGKILVFSGDALPTGSHVPVPYVMGYDNEPIRCLAEKRELLSQAVRDRWAFVWCHDPFRAASLVVEEGGKFRRGEDVPL